MNGDANCCAITVAAEAGRGWSSRMKDRFRQRPTLLKPSANNGTCCIFKVPKSQLESDSKAYEPRIVSVGPYHRGKGHLEMIEQHKPRLFSAMLDRTRDYGADLDQYFEEVALLETSIRDSYSEALDCEALDLIEMMILDACFIVEIFRVTASVIEPDEDDPVFTMPRIFSFLTIDLLLIENQIPFFVLQKIYDLSKSPSEAVSLNAIALVFFRNVLRWPWIEFQRYCRVSIATHLLDLLRLSMVGHLELDNPQAVDEKLQPMPSAKQLLLEGIIFRPREGENPTDVEFYRGVLRIPPVTLDAFTTPFFFNCVTFEQCYHSCSKHITSYMIFMRCLVSRAEDAKFLSRRSIVKNYIGTDKEVAKFFNDLSKDVPFNIRSSYLAEVFRQVDQQRRVKWHAWKAQIQHLYFADPWSFQSFMFSFTALILSIIQAFAAVYTLYYPRK